MPSRLDRERRLAARHAVAEAARRGELRLPDAVRALRHAFGLNQEEFGRLFRLTRRQISELENGTGDPKLSTLARVARVFGMSVGFVPAPAEGVSRSRETGPAPD